jgi:hypothetical protein
VQRRLLLLHLVLSGRPQNPAQEEDAMPAMLRRTRTSLLGLAVLAALGFGASSALAEARRLPECTDPLADGPCGSDSGCSADCKQWYGPGTIGSCNESTYCCYCVEL